MSPEESLNIGILRAAQRFVSSTENGFALAHHHHFTIDETESFAFTLKK
jgi:hypothetical protein